MSRGPRGHEIRLGLLFPTSGYGSYTVETEIKLSRCERAGDMQMLTRRAAEMEDMEFDPVDMEDILYCPCLDLELF